MHTTLAHASPEIVQRRRAIADLIRLGWKNDEIVAALGWKRSTAYAEIRRVRREIDRADAWREERRAS